MALHLIRHANAGARPEWGQPDDLRALTDGGVLQAERVAEALAGVGIDRILSSRYVRCVQTVEPLARRLGLAVEEHPALAEEAGIDDTWALLVSLESAEVAMCSHGNVIGGVLDRAARRGAPLVGRGCAKGSVWTVDVSGGEVREARLSLDGG